MAALKVAVVVMGLMIVAGTAVLAVLIVQRLSHPAATPAPGLVAATTLDEPSGTRIAGVSATESRLALRLEGGGPDRVVVLDLRSGRAVLRASLAR